MKRALSLVAVLILSILALPARAESIDIVMKALKDEMARSMKRLELNGRGAPYFIYYNIREFDRIELAASCGALSQNEHSRWRDLIVDVRTGNYSLDSSNFNSTVPGMSAANATADQRTLVIDDDYNAIRHTLWLRTDAAYKAAVENLEAKKSYLQQHNVRERPEDMSKEKVTVFMEPPSKIEIDTDHWKAIVKRLSSVFEQYPDIQRSLVTLKVDCCNSRCINSEGMKCQQGQTYYELISMASLQADDGEELADSQVFAATTERDLPSVEIMETAIKEMSRNLTQLKSAKLADNYSGPILFEGQSAAELFNQLLRGDLGASQEKLDSENNSFFARTSDQLKNSLGRRILPTFISITDDPLTQEFKSIRLVGGYKIDDDGIPAQKIVLIDKGILRTLCMSRIPTTDIKHSNGHSVYGIGETSILYVNSDKQQSLAELKSKLVQLGKDNGLKSVMIVRRLSSDGYNLDSFDPGFVSSEAKSYMNSASGGLFLRSPLLLYSISVDDGHEELLRGAQFNGLSMRLFRDIIGTGDDTSPYIVYGYSGAYEHLITPSILISDMELRKSVKETDKLPVLSNPAFEK
jgi:hypothetical protein